MAATCCMNRYLYHDGFYLETIRIQNRYNYQLVVVKEEP